MWWRYYTCCIYNGVKKNPVHNITIGEGIIQEVYVYSFSTKHFEAKQATQDWIYDVDIDKTTYVRFRSSSESTVNNWAPKSPTVGIAFIKLATLSTKYQK